MPSWALIFTALMLFSACGKRETIAEKIVEKSIENNTTQAPFEAPIVETCKLEPIGLGYTLTCASHTILVNGTTLSNIEINQDELILTASQIVSDSGSGEEETQWFDAVVEFETEKNLLLPEVISASKTLSANQKVYIQFNENLECVWFSNEDIEYHQYRCFENATRALDSEEGFIDGNEVFITVVEEITQVKMHITGSEELDISTSNAVLSFQ